MTVQHDFFIEASPVTKAGMMISNLFRFKFEMKHMRTKYSKTFYKGNNQYQLISSMMPLHYPDDKGEWQNITYELNDKNEMLHGIYYFRLLEDDFGYYIRHKEDEGGYWVRLKSIGGVKPQFFKPVQVENKIIWNQIIPGLDLSIHVLPHRIRVWRNLHHKDVPYEVEWEIIEENGVEKLKTVDRLLGYDANKVQVYTTREKEVIEKEAKKIFRMKDTFTGKTLVRDEVTRRMEYGMQAPAFPVMIDADIDVTVNESADDKNGWKIYTGTTNLTSSGVSNVSTRLWIEYASGSARSFQESCTLFNGITIPQSSTIDSATLTLRATGLIGAPVPVTIRALDNLTANQPANNTDLIDETDIATNTAVTSITAFSAFGIDVQSIVQELVNSYEYSNHNMLFFQRTRADGDRALFAAYDHATSAWHPNLAITYTSAAGAAQAYSSVKDISLKGVRLS